MLKIQYKILTRICVWGEGGGGGGERKREREREKERERKRERGLFPIQIQNIFLLCMKCCYDIQWYDKLLFMPIIIYRLKDITIFTVIFIS